MPPGFDCRIGVRCAAHHLGITSTRGPWCTYLVEGVFNNHLTISIWYPGKQIPDRCVSLFVNVLLSLRDGLGKASRSPRGRKLVVAKGSAGLVHDGLTDVVANPVQMSAESLGKPSS